MENVLQAEIPTTEDMVVPKENEDGEIETPEVKIPQISPNLLKTAVQNIDQEKIMQVLGFLWFLVELILPVCSAITGFFMANWERYNLDDIVPLSGGIVMTFLGGHYMSTIAAGEAVKLCGWRRTKTAAQVVFYNCRKAHYEMQRESHNWKKSKLTDQQITNRKMLILLRCIDPDQLSNLLMGVWTSLLSVMACLRTKFVRVVTLGNGLGGIIAKSFVGKYLETLVSKATPTAYQKWAPVITRYTIKCICMLVAFMVVRVVCAIHSAARGATLVQRGLDHLAVKKKLLSKLNPKSPLYSILQHAFLFVGICLACLGCYWQLTTQFAMPWWLSLILFPFSFMEWILTRFIVFL